MMKLNEFRLTQETAFLFVLSYEYELPFAKMLSIYNISAKIFWAMLSLVTPMSKMGVRKASQLAKIANRIYKNIYEIKEVKKTKVEYNCTDEDGNLVYTEKGNIKTVRRTKVDYLPIILDDYENKIKNLIKCFITQGYSDGGIFYTDGEVCELGVPHTALRDYVIVRGEKFYRTTQIEFIMEKYFPDITLQKYRELSIKELERLFKTINEYEEAECMEA